MSDDFDWCDGEDIVIQHQPGLAVYENARGAITLRQERESCQDEDPIVVVTLSALPALIAKLQSYLPRQEAALITDQRGGRGRPTSSQKQEGQLFAA